MQIKPKLTIKFHKKDKIYFVGFEDILYVLDCVYDKMMCFENGIDVKVYSFVVLKGSSVWELVRPITIYDKEKLISWGEKHSHTIIFEE